MDFTFSPLEATLIDRPNRFLVIARLQENGSAIQAHCPDPGRLLELLIPGVTVYVSASDKPGRKTAYDLRFVKHPQSGQLVSLDSHLPNRLFWHELHMGNLAPFFGVHSVRREVSLPRLGNAPVISRIDFSMVDHEGHDCWVEVKSATLVENGLAKFPDAPTARGRRHVLELAERVSSTEDRAAIVFVVQRPDAYSLSPNWKTDPDFGKALVHAAGVGVRLFAFSCALTTENICISRQIPVVLHGLE